MGVKEPETENYPGLGFIIAEMLEGVGANKRSLFIVLSDTHRIKAWRAIFRNK